MPEKIGFIGLGIMGQGMVRNLHKAGFSLTVWNRTPTKTEPFRELGITVADTPADVARHSDIIVTCVSDSPDMEVVVLGENGVIHGAQAGSLLIDCSTISPQTTITIAEKLDKHGMTMLDAPISGGSEGAAKGTLSIMVGGAEADFIRAQPILSAMGKTITHVGGQGAGQMVKLVNQILVVGTMQAISEALIFAQAGGLDLEKTLAAVSGGAAGSWMLSNRAPQVINRDWRPGFTIDLQQKDLRIVLDTADQLGAPVPSTSLIFNFYRTLQAHGLGEEGNHALIKALENLSGITVQK